MSRRVDRTGRVRMPSLDDYDLSKRDDYETMQSGSWDKGRGIVRSGAGTGEGLRMISGGGCWCGLRFGHDWPGRDDGVPHPRGDMLDALKRDSRR